MTPFIPRPLVRLNQWFIVLSVAISWVVQSPWILAIPLVVGLLGLLFNFNPLMRFGKMFLRKPVSEYIPEDKSQQQFNQVIAVICLAASLVCSTLHFTIASYVFSVMVFLAAFIAILGFCVGCYIRFQWTMYRHRRSMRS